MESNVKNSDLNLKINVEIDSGLTKQESDSSSSSTKEVDNLNEENAPLDDTSITQEDEGSSVVKVVVESYHGNDDDDDSDNSDDSVKDKEDDRSVSPHSSGRHRDDQDFDLFNVNPASDDCHSDDEDHLHTSSNYTSSLVDEESLRSQVTNSYLFKAKPSYLLTGKCINKFQCLKSRVCSSSYRKLSRLHCWNITSQ